MSNQIEFVGEKYEANGCTWTPAYDQWRRNNHLCNSPIALAGFGKKMLLEDYERQRMKAWRERPWWRRLLDITNA